MFCTRVKEFLSQKRVDYIERDVTRDDQAMAELEALGYLTTPVLTVDDEVIVGFDRRRIETLLP